MQNKWTKTTSLMAVLTLLSMPILASTASLSTATQQMREQFPNSPIGLFVNNQQKDYRNLRQFLNNQNNQVMSHMAGIQKHLAANRDDPQYDKMYQDLERAFVSLAFCREAHRRLNEVTIRNRINAEAAVSYSVSARSCENPLLRDFVMQSGMVDVWKAFNERVIASIPLDAETSKLLQHKLALPVVEQAKRLLAQYRPGPAQRSLKPVALVQNEQTSTTLAAEGMTPLPQPPFKHDQQEMKSIALHIELLLKKLEKRVPSTKSISQTCQSLLSSNTADTKNIEICAMILPKNAMPGNEGLQQSIKDFQSFIVEYGKSENAKRTELVNANRAKANLAKQAKLKQDQQVVQPETAVGPSAISEQARWMEENRPMPTPKKISVGNDVSAFPLPQPPFKYDQQEMLSVVLHATAMANKHLIVSKNARPPRKCTTLINANRPITIYNVRGCTNTLQLIAKHTTKKQLFIDLHDFTVNYQKAEAAKRPKKVILPIGPKAMFTVSELKLFRDYIQAIDVKDLESCPDTNTGGLSDDLSNPENKKRFAAVVQALANCSKTLQQKDNQNYRRFARAMKSYHRGFAKAAR
jgi:hypothetical protein